MPSQENLDTKLLREGNLIWEFFFFDIYYFFGPEAWLLVFGFWLLFCLRFLDGFHFFPKAVIDFSINFINFSKVFIVENHGKIDEHMNKPMNTMEKLMKFMEHRWNTWKKQWKPWRYLNQRYDKYDNIPWNYLHPTGFCLNLHSTYSQGPCFLRPIPPPAFLSPNPNLHTCKYTTLYRWKNYMNR